MSPMTTGTANGDEHFLRDGDFIENWDGSFSTSAYGPVHHKASQAWNDQNASTDAQTYLEGLVVSTFADIASSMAGHTISQHYMNSASNVGKDNYAGTQYEEINGDWSQGGIVE